MKRCPARATDGPRREWGTKQIGVARKYFEVLTGMSPMVGSLYLLGSSGKAETAHGLS